MADKNISKSPTDIIESKQMNIYGRLQKCRVELQKSNLKKSGINKFAGFEYFELGDFLPRINELLYENNLAAIYHFDREEATLRIIDCDDTSQEIVFSTPVAMAELKGTHAIQNIGATQTYTRRYLYVMAFEITESDVLDSLDPKEKAAQDAERKAEEEKRKLAESYINEVKINSVLKAIADAHYSEEKLCSFYKIDAIDAITNEMYPRVMNSLASMKKKLVEDASLKKRYPKDDKTESADQEDSTPKSEGELNI